MTGQNPEKIVRHMDFGTLEIMNGSYVDEAFAERHSDMVYRIKTDGKDTFGKRWARLRLK